MNLVVPYIEMEINRRRYEALGSKKLCNHQLRKPCTIKGNDGDVKLLIHDLRIFSFLWKLCKLGSSVVKQQSSK